MFEPIQKIRQWWKRRQASARRDAELEKRAKRHAAKAKARMAALRRRLGKAPRPDPTAPAPQRSWIDPNLQPPSEDEQQAMAPPGPAEPSTEAPRPQPPPPDVPTRSDVPPGPLQSQDAAEGWVAPGLDVSAESPAETPEAPKPKTYKIGAIEMDAPPPPTAPTSEAPSLPPMTAPTPAAEAVEAVAETADRADVTGLGPMTTPTPAAKAVEEAAKDRPPVTGLGAFTTPTPAAKAIEKFAEFADQPPGADLGPAFAAPPQEEAPSQRIPGTSGPREQGRRVPYQEMAADEVEQLGISPTPIPPPPTRGPTMADVSREGPRVPEVPSGMDGLPGGGGGDAGGRDALQDLVSSMDEIKSTVTETATKLIDILEKQSNAMTELVQKIEMIGTYGA